MLKGYKVLWGVTVRGDGYYQGYFSGYCNREHQKGLRNGVQYLRLGLRFRGVLVFLRLDATQS